MPCLQPDGRPTESGVRMLAAIKTARLPEDVARETGMPIYRVRSGLRDLSEAGYAKEEQGKYVVTDAGIKAMQQR